MSWRRSGPGGTLLLSVAVAAAEQDDDGGGEDGLSDGGVEVHLTLAG